MLGKVPLGGKQFAHLMHVGNKLALISITPAGAETLVEIDDPQEVQRLLALCVQNNSGSSSAEFNDVLRRLAKEPAPKGFLGDSQQEGSYA